MKETATSKPKDGIWWKERHQNICRATKINLNESPISATSPTNLEGVPPSRRKSIMKEEELFSKKKRMVELIRSTNVFTLLIFYD